MKKQRVKIMWFNEQDNWKYFELLEIKPGFVLLCGVDDPETGIKHTGNSFWCNSSLIEVMEIVE